MIKKKQNISIKNKLINHLLIKGKKNKSEKIVLKSIKILQTESKKSLKKLVQLALIFNIPVFKIDTITQKEQKKKKEETKIIPVFVSEKLSRISFATKFIVKTVKTKGQSLFQKLPVELLLASQNKSQSIQTKKETQKQIFSNSHLFKYYRWH